MFAKKKLIVNADDFGQSFGVNRGIIEAHEHGIVTSASLMVRYPAVSEAAAYGREHPDLSVGLHLDLGEWIYRNREWVQLYQVTDLNDIHAVRKEIEIQIAAFRVRVGTNPTHLDSHQHSHRTEPARSVVLSIGEQLGIPVRGFKEEIRYCGSFYGQTDEGVSYPEGISVQNLINMVQSLPPGCTEFGCHPGYYDNLETMYRHEREQELRTLCDPLVRKALVDSNVELTAFGRE